ncbi:MFS transporter [Mitsuokella jalaludinii]|uniref:MFS transporter n=1 Tax=Mitsuokella jalaludinii TaxID=187979 RepID=UPI003A8CDC0C
MTTEKLWSRDFIALTAANGLLFAGFHILLPTLPIYVASLGASGSEIGLIAGIFGYSAIFIRLFTDTGVRAFGKKTCLYAGLLFSLLATAGYALLDSVGAIVAARVIHGFGFGLSTTFAAALVADVIPASRRGEGIGYFGLGSTIAMALAPAFGLVLLSDISPWGPVYRFWRRDARSASCRPPGPHSREGTGAPRAGRAPLLPQPPL